METRLHQINGLLRYRKHEITPDALLVDQFIAQIKIAQARFIRKEYRAARANEKI